MKMIKKLFTVLLTLLSIGVAIAYLYFISPEPFRYIEGFIFQQSQEILKKNVKETAMQHAEKHTDPNYICPMHPQIIKDEMGSCPICGMDLVEKKVPKTIYKQASKQTAMQHAEKHTNPNYVCPMHPQIIKDESGNCPICGMNLVKKENTSKNEVSKKDKKPLYWVAPMDSNYRRDKPGKSPMGMDLVPVYDESISNNKQDKYPSITVKPHIAQNMGVRTATVKKEALSRAISTVGFISYNEDKLQHVHTRTEGWVENIVAKSQGEYVKKGSKLFDYYSPELVAAQEDYLLALKGFALYSKKGERNLIESAKTKMRLIGVPDSVIKKITRTKQSVKHIPVYAPTSGTITQLDVRKGMHIVPTTVLYSIENLSSIWVIVDVFEHQLNWVKQGNLATIRIEALADKEWQGHVDYIYPELAPVTRTLRVRLIFDNPKGQFKPNMFANVSIQGDVHDGLVVPNEAIILAESGKRIVKVIGDNEYQPVTIRTGIKSNGKTEVLEGLKAGDKVVVSSQFLLDSESNLQASFRRLSE